MNVVFFTHYYTPEGNAPASRTHEHCLRWVKEGVDVTVITNAPNVPNGVVYEGYENRIWPQQETIDGVNIIRVWSFIAPNSGAIRRILNYMTYMLSAIIAFVFFVRRPKLIIATSPQFFCGWAGIICSWLKWSPLLLEIRDIWPESIVAVGAMKRGVAVSFLELLEKWMYLSANHIVAVGKGYKRAILRRAPSVKSVSVITNGVDLAQFKPEPPSDSFLERWGLQNKFVCSYVGTLGMAHGLEVALDAAEVLKGRGITNIKFCLVGDGAHREWLEAETSKRGLSDYLVFTGRLPKSEMPKVLASSDALFIHLKKCDLFTTVIPSKIFEAMAMAKPIIMGVDGEAKDIVRASGSGIDMEPGNVEQLVDAVCQLANDPELMERLSEEGREFVQKHYTRDVLAKHFLETMRAIVNRKPLPDLPEPACANTLTKRSNSMVV